VSVGRDGVAEPVAPAEGPLQIERNRATLRHQDGSEEWVLCGPLGIEQGFVLASRPMSVGSATTGWLDLTLQVGGGLEPSANRDGSGIELRGAAGSRVLRYTDLHAVDTKRESLAVRMAVVDGAIVLRIDDRNASYPVTIDPLVWVTVQTLTAPVPAANAEFGDSVAIWGDIAIVASYYEFDSVGAAYVFERTMGGTDAWGLRTQLVPSGWGSGFGTATAVEGDFAIVGASREFNGVDRVGAAYVFERDLGGNENWGLRTKLVASDPQADDWFGGSVAISGDLAIVGAHSNTHVAPYAGAAYVFERNLGGNDNWGERKKITALDALEAD